MTQIHYTYEPDSQRIIAETDDGIKAGEIRYTVDDLHWVANHTWVDPAYRGFNIARTLVDILADTARAARVQILPTCSYAKHVMEKNPSFEDVLFKPANSEEA